MTNFAITGAAGYIAPRHLKAIQEVGGRLVAALDPHDSVGILDSFGYDVQYFTDFERFDRHLIHVRGTTDQVDYVSVCSPNHLHEAHARSALRAGASAIVEKPLVVNPENLALLESEETPQRRVWSIMQMRYHPEIERLKSLLEANPDKYHIVTMTYVTPRGGWYQRSWKADPEKSGGLPMNIGVHLFDLLIWLFGKVVSIDWTEIKPLQISGDFHLESASINYFLSIDPNFGKPRRMITVDNYSPVDFTVYGGELHTKAYREILAGRGFGIKDARPAIELVHNILNQQPDKSQVGG